MSIFTRVIKTVFGTKSDKDLKSLHPYIEQINIITNGQAQMKYGLITIKI